MTAKKDGLEVYGDIRVLHSQVKELSFKYRQAVINSGHASVLGVLNSISDELYFLERELVQAAWDDTPLGQEEKKNRAKRGSSRGALGSEVEP